MHTSPTDRPGSGDAGGLNVYVRELGDRLVAAGWEVEILTRRVASDQPRALRSAGGALVRFLDAGPSGPVTKEQLPDRVRAFADRLAALEPFQVYHSHYWLSAAAAGPVAAAEGAPHVLSLHTIAALKNRHRAPGQPAEPMTRVRRESALARGAAAVLASTRAERDALIAEYRVDAHRIDVIEPGVDLGIFHPRHSAAVAGSRDTPTVLIVGRVQPLKRQDLAIRALARLPPARRPQLVLVGDASGPGGGYPDHLRGLVETLGLGASVVFAGAESRDRVAERMADAALVLIPSASETYGLVALEAAASGVPVIATDAAGLRDSVADGVTGLLVPRAADPAVEEAAWADRMMGLLADHRWRRRLGQAGIARASVRTWEETARRTAEVYGRVIAQ